MTDRSKSQRKRRLQLNAEDFAPPPNLYEASDEPRLDETWVQYYGGEKQGGLKRLLPIDEEAATGQQEDGAADARHRLASDSGLKGPEDGGNVETTASRETHEAETLDTSSPDLTKRSVVSSMEDFRKHDAAKASDAPAPPPADGLFTGEPSKRMQTTAADAGARPESASASQSSSLQALSDAPSFDEWSKRWSPWLKRGGSIKVCQAFFKLTHARGSAECFTSNSAIMELTNLSRAQCIRNIHYLIEIGFLDELSEVNNREAKGTYYRFNLIPRSLVTE